MSRRPPLPLAARVAEKVMGWSETPPRDDPRFDKGVYYDIFLDPDGWHVNRPGTAITWDPLANPGDLMDVIGEMRKRGLRCCVEVLDFEVAAGFHAADAPSGSRAQNVTRGDWRSALARAVCRAALEAVR